MKYCCAHCKSDDVDWTHKQGEIIGWCSTCGEIAHFDYSSELRIDEAKSNNLASSNHAQNQ